MAPKKSSRSAPPRRPELPTSTPGSKAEQLISESESKAELPRLSSSSKEESMQSPAFPGPLGAGGGAGVGYVKVAGSEITPLPGAFIVGRPRPRKLIEVSLLLRSRQNAPSLNAEEIGAQPAHERRHLTREEFAQAHGIRIGPRRNATDTDPDVLQVLRFARRHGLQHVGTNPAARLVNLAGTIAAFSRAFRVKLFIYRYGRRFYRGRTGPVRVPESLAPIVQGVFGLDNRPQARPHFRRARRLGGFRPSAQGVSYSPTQVAQLYKFPAGATGANECIGIIELGGGYTAADLNVWFHRQNIPLPQIVSVSVNGGQNRPTGNPNGPDGEVMLDIEVAGAVAPGAKIAVYFAPNTTLGFLRAIARAVHDQAHRPSVISISWGKPESSWTAQALNAMNQVLQAAAAMGVTVCVATGDGGSSDRVPGRLAHADFPASSPFALACGGTRLDSSNGEITGETVWNDGPAGGATGGGISDFFPLPAWQGNANVPKSVNPGTKDPGRGLPDVAGDADPQTGYCIRADGMDMSIGGTSAVAPLWAGLIALMNEKLGKPIGYLNPLLYQTLAARPGVFRDITQGENDMTGRVGGYKAGPGWDPCSGFGSPDGTALLGAL
jgi:kumamolisin